MSIHSHRTKPSSSTQSNYVNIEQFYEQFEYLRHNMATKEEISKIAQALANLAKKKTEPYFEKWGYKKTYNTPPELYEGSYMERNPYASRYDTQKMEQIPYTSKYDTQKRF